MNRMRLLEGPFSYRLIRGTFRPAPGRGGGGVRQTQEGASMGRLTATLAGLVVGMNMLA